MPTKWDDRFLNLARLVASWSKDPSTRTGAVIVDPLRRVVSLGYNGFPRQIADDDRLLDRQVKYSIVVHCEVNALVNANRSVEKCTLYTWPFMSCAPCASIMIQAGIARVVAPNADVDRWKESWEQAQRLFKEAHVKVRLV